MTAERKFSRLQISLRTFLLVVNLTVLALPLAGVQLLRLYESALVRQTESTLIAQAAFVSAFYRSFVVEFGTQDWMNISRPIIGEINNNADGWIPRPPELDLSTSPLLPPYPDSLSSKVANAYALKIGNKLSPVLKDAQLTTLAAIRVVDPWGVVVASTANDTGEDISHGIEIQQALLGKPSSQIRQKTDLIDAKVSDPFSRSSQVRVFVASPILLHNRVVGAVMLSRTPPNIFQALYAKRWLLLQALTLMVVLVIVLTLLSYRLVTRPIRRLATQAEDVSRGRARGLQSLQRHNLPRTKELANLQSAITDMARSLADRSTYLTNFSRHVSHEFKTPIASIRAGVELFADHHQTL